MQMGKWWVVLWTLVFCIPVGYCQDAVMVLDHKEIGIHQRPRVRFEHEKHMDNVDCLRCHHDYDANLNNKGGDGRPCADCHKPGGASKLTHLTDAFHGQCKGCHEAMQAFGKPAGPVTCGECHVRP